MQTDSRQHSFPGKRIYHEGENVKKSKKPGAYWLEPSTLLSCRVQVAHLNRMPVNNFWTSRVLRKSTSPTGIWRFSTGNDVWYDVIGYRFIDDITAPRLASMNSFACFRSFRIQYHSSCRWRHFCTNLPSDRQILLWLIVLLWLALENKKKCCVAMDSSISTRSTNGTKAHEETDKNNDGVGGGTIDRGGSSWIL
jgi:hypothetical protein